jgi:hypothetical protein
MLSPMVSLAALGLGPARAPLIAPVALGRSGNAITVSGNSGQMRAAGTPARRRGHGPGACDVIAERANSKLEPLTVAMVFPFSCTTTNSGLARRLGRRPGSGCGWSMPPPLLVVHCTRASRWLCVATWNSQAVASGVRFGAGHGRSMPAAPQRVAALVRAIEALPR